MKKPENYTNFDEPKPNSILFN